MGSTIGYDGNDKYLTYIEWDKEVRIGWLSLEGIIVLIFLWYDRVVQDDISNGKSNASTSDFSSRGQSDILSLLSLKDSGLLDLWNPGLRDLKPPFLDDDWQQSPPLQEQLLPPIAGVTGSHVRSSTSFGMPIGLPWLTHNSR